MFFDTHFLVNCEVEVVGKRTNSADSLQVRLRGDIVKLRLQGRTADFDVARYVRH